MQKGLIGKYGVYAILIDDVVRYIGSGGLESRKSNHLSRLRKCIHNKDLQKLFNEYGEEKFKFYVLDYCSEDMCFKLERLHKMIHSDTTVKGNEIRNTVKKIRTGQAEIQHKQKFKELFQGEKNPNNTKLSVDDVREIRKLLKDGQKTQKEIANEYGVSETHVNNIWLGKRWASVS